MDDNLTENGVSRREMLQSMAGLGVLLPLSKFVSVEECIAGFEELPAKEQVEELIFGLYVVSFRVQSLQEQVDALVNPKGAPNPSGRVRSNSSTRGYSMSVSQRTGFHAFDPQVHSG
jgi:hypothetical protein